MRKLSILFFTIAATALPPTAAAEITLQGIASGEYYPQSMRSFSSSPDGESYMQISEDGKQLLSYSFKNGAQNGVVIDLNTTRGDKVGRIEGYILSPDGKRILVQTATSSIYRHSFTAEYYIYDVGNKTLTALSSGGAQMQPQFSPDGTMISFVRGGNLFLVKLLFDNSESQVTQDGEVGKVLNGVPDWVNEEEFSTACSYVFTADSKMLVWVRYDEAAVKTFSFPLYKGMSPERVGFAEYPGQYSYKYPVAGEANSQVSVRSYDIKSHVERTVKVPLDGDGYIPRIFQTSDPEKIAVVTLNRHQDQMDIYAANPRSTVCKLLVREKSDKYLREAAFDKLRFYGDHFAMVSDRSGYNNIYWYDINGHLLGQVTKGDYEVQDFYGYDAKTGNFYYSANADGPQYTAVMCANLKGNVRKLTTQKGDNSARFSANFQYFVNTYSSISSAPETTLRNSAGKVLKTLIDNSALKQKLDADAPVSVEMFELTTSTGTKLNGYMVKPANFDAGKKYPVVMYQYSGPGSQEVKDSWGAGFMGGLVGERYLAQEGFICVCVDGRGTGGRGADFEKQTYLKLGLMEAQDQVEAALWLGKQSYIDKDRIGIWGWSYGGFNTLMSMSEGRGVFRAGVAIAPVTSYRFYDTIYTERYMRTPAENSAGYDDCPISRAANLHGDLLLIHGTADDNVHYQNSAEYSEALVQAGKQFQMQVYTNRNHSIYGGQTRLHLYTRLAQFFKDKLAR